MFEQTRNVSARLASVAPTGVALSFLTPQFPMQAAPSALSLLFLETQEILKFSSHM